MGSTFRFSVPIGVFDTTSDTPFTGEMRLCIDQEWILVKENGKNKEPAWIRQPVGRRGLKYDLEKPVEGDGERGRKGEWRVPMEGIPMTSPETPGALTEGTVVSPGPSEDIWFAAVESAKKKRGREDVGEMKTSALETLERPRILIVDDVRVNRMLLRKMVEALDVEVELAEDGEKAVKACSISRFTIILMDVMMPVMDGFEASGAIRSQAGGLNQETPIIATTASPSLNDLSASEATDVTDVLVTPLTRRSLFSMMALYAREPDISRMTAAWLKYTATQKGARVAQSAAPRSALRETISTLAFGNRQVASSSKAVHFPVVADVQTVRP